MKKKTLGGGFFYGLFGYKKNYNFFHLYGKNGKSR